MVHANVDTYIRLPEIERKTTLGCFSAKVRKFIIPDLTFMGLIGFPASVITNLETENFTNEQLKVHKSIFPKIFVR